MATWHKTNEKENGVRPNFRYPSSSLRAVSCKSNEQRTLYFGRYTAIRNLLTLLMHPSCTRLWLIMGVIKISKAPKTKDGLPLCILSEVVGEKR
jgi:hypothetical protein